MLSDAESREVTEFLFTEAEILDARRFSEWLALLAEEIRYVVYAPTTITDGAEERRVPLLDEDISSLRARVAQISTPQFTISENPPSIDRRFVTNIRAAIDVGGDCITVRSNVLLRRARGVGTEPHVFSTSRQDAIRRVDGRLRLWRRTVQLDDVVVGSSRLSVFF